MERTLTASEASKLSGKSPTTIRRWGKSGFIEQKKNHNGNYEYSEQSLRSYLATQREHVSDVKEQESSSQLLDSLNAALLREQKALAREQEALARERRINDELREENKKQQSELLKLTYEMQAILKKESGNKLSRWIKDVVS